MKSNFSCPHIIFKRLVLQTRKNKGLFEKGSRYVHIHVYQVMVISIFSFHNVFKRFFPSLFEVMIVRSRLVD